MGNKIYNTKLFRFMEHKMTLRVKCYDCKAWHKKVCTFRGKNGKRYCASCADTLSRRRRLANQISLCLLSHLEP